MKRVIDKLLLVGIVALLSLSLFACSKNNSASYVTFDENLPVNELIKQKQEVYKTMNENVTITPEEAARGKTIENTKRTVNEYGVTVYGRKLDKNESIYSKIEDKDPEVWSYTYTEYYSDAYGGKVYIKSNDKNGGLEIFNEKGQRFLAGKKPQNDIEVGLANYRMGNAMAEAIDRSVKNNK